MELNLEKPLVFFDIESTGLNIASDSIIELCFVKIMPGGEQRVKTWRVKPWDYETCCQRAINPSAQAVHGICAEDLADCPTFYQITEEVASWLEGCDLAGFNSAKFDLPMLAEEFERVAKYTDKKPAVDLHSMKMVDVQNIFHMMEPRTLKAAYMFYCGQDLTIGFKSPFIIEILSNMNCGELVMKFLDSKRAALILPTEEEAESEKICGIIMPIMI